MSRASFQSVAILRRPFSPVWVLCLEEDVFRYYDNHPLAITYALTRFRRGREVITVNVE